MNTSDANRNLLCGILALQMDFVSREQLIAATSVWIADKSQRLDQILRRRCCFWFDCPGAEPPLDRAALGMIVDWEGMEEE